MSSSFSDKCYGTRNTCPVSSVTSCSHYEDVTVECSKLDYYNYEFIMSFDLCYCSCSNIETF